MACHVRIASENAKLGQPEVKLGIVPGYGGTQRLPRLVGRGAALALLLTGDMIDAAEALPARPGRPGRACGRADRHRDALMTAMLANAPLALAGCIEAVDRGSRLLARRRLPHRGRPVRPAVQHRRHARRHARVSREARRRVHRSLSADLARMRRATSSCRDFRNLGIAIDLEVDAGTRDRGRERHGKTNLLEAVAYLRCCVRCAARAMPTWCASARRRFMCAPSSALPAPGARRVRGYERATQAQARHARRRRAAAADRCAGSRCLRCASRRPTSLLVAGGPGERRRYLDVALALTSPPYLRRCSSIARRCCDATRRSRLAQRDSRRAAAPHVDRVASGNRRWREHGRRDHVRFGAMCVERMPTRSRGLCHAIGESRRGALRYRVGGERARDDDVSVDAAQLAAHAGCGAAAHGDAARHDAGGSASRRAAVPARRTRAAHVRLGGTAAQAAIALRLLELATRREAVLERHRCCCSTIRSRSSTRVARARARAARGAGSARCCWRCRASRTFRRRSRGSSGAYHGATAQCCHEHDARTSARRSEQWRKRRPQRSGDVLASVLEQAG